MKKKWNRELQNSPDRDCMEYFCERPVFDNLDTKYPVLLRPRRFGKSTFVQMLDYFYDIAKKDQYDEVFRGTKIHEMNLPSHNSYHAIFLIFVFS